VLKHNALWPWSLIGWTAWSNIRPPKQPTIKTTGVVANPSWVYDYLPVVALRKGSLLDFLDLDFKHLFLPFFGGLMPVTLSGLACQGNLPPTLLLL